MMKVFSSRLVFGSALLCLLTGCAIIDEKIIADDVLAHRAAITLDVPDNKISVSERSSESSFGFSTLYFTANIAGSSAKRCHVNVGVFGLVKGEVSCIGVCSPSQKADGKCK